MRGNGLSAFAVHGVRRQPERRVDAARRRARRVHGQRARREAHGLCRLRDESGGRRGAVYPADSF